MVERSRRSFMKVAGATSLGLGLAGSLPFRTLAAPAGPAKEYEYTGWEQFHRDQWSWDKKTRGAHLINCTGACPHFVYQKNGIITREEQSKDAPSLNGVPEHNPRGCNKGECATDYVYGAQRLKFPLIRTGERGEGKWRRATWDEALGMIATKIIDTIQMHGPDAVSVYSPVPAVAPVSFAGGHRFAHLIGAHVHTFFDWYGDQPPGQTQTCGVQGDTAETADWYNARYIMLWGANPSQTRIPDAHFLSEAVLNGTKLIAVAPDYNASAIKADMWVHPRPGTDVALGLGMANVILKEKLYDAANLKEQTDMPLLVRGDNKRFLREADMVEGGSINRFYAWDLKTGKPVLMRGSWGDEPEMKPTVQPPFLARNTLTFPDGTLALGNLDPALEGRFKVTLLGGAMVECRPVFELYRDRIAKDYTPDKVQGLTGVAAATVTLLAREYAMAKPAMIITGGGTGHWFYSDILMRVFHFLSSLTANEGKNGGGVNHYIGQWKPVFVPGVAALAFPQGAAKQRFTQTTIWTSVHSDAYDGMENTGIDTAKYLRDAIRTKQMPLYPRDGGDPKVFICYRGNFLNQAKGQKYVLRNLWPKLDLIVTANIRMDSQALYSDIVLPSAHWYEKTDLNVTEEHTFINMTEPAIAPLWESKTDWQIFKALSKKVEEVAVAKGFTKFFDEQFKWARDLTTLSAQFTDNGKFDTDEAACQFILDTAPQSKGITLDALREKPIRFKGNWTSPLKEGVPYTPFQFFAVNKRPWPTLTGRQQFYIDHEVFFSMGVELPVYKAPIDADKYPLRFNTPHSRHSIHSTFKDNELMLRLQRGGPMVEVPPNEAAARGLKDNDWAEIFNDHGRVIVRIKIKNGEQPGRISMYHTPELYMDLIEGSSQSVCPIRITPTHLVGNYGHLLFRPNYYGPGGSQRDTRVEMRKYTGTVTTQL
jgi:nitrate reductase alpha subunit